MTRKRYFLLNLGRDKDENHSTYKIDDAILDRLTEAICPRGKTIGQVTNTVVFFVEINEGDDNNEMALIKRHFPGWHVYGQGTHEPILLSPDLKGKGSVVRLKGTAVPHWSPERSILTVRVAGEDESLQAVHYAAGPHTAGDRPKKYQKPLEESWDITREAHQREHAKELRAGQNVTSFYDANHYSLPRLDGEVPVVHERTDYGRASAAAGYRVSFRGLSPITAGLDSHRILRMEGSYTKGRG